MSFRKSCSVSVEISGSASHCCSRSGSSAVLDDDLDLLLVERGVEGVELLGRRDRARRGRARARPRRRCPRRDRSRAAPSPRRQSTDVIGRRNRALGFAMLRSGPPLPSRAPDTVAISPRAASKNSADRSDTRLRGARRGSAPPRGRAASPARPWSRARAGVFASFTSPGPEEQEAEVEPDGRAAREPARRAARAARTPRPGAPCRSGRRRRRPAPRRRPGPRLRRGVEHAHARRAAARAAAARRRRGASRRRRSRAPRRSRSSCAAGREIVETVGQRARS